MSFPLWLFCSKVPADKSTTGCTVAEKRKKDGLSTLRLFVIKVVSPQDVLDPNTVSKEELVSAKIGSTQIRRRLRERLDNKR